MQNQSGNYQGIDKLKISTNLEGFAQPTAQQAPTAAPLPPAVLPGVSANLVPIHGASAGMAVKEAIPSVQMTMGGLEWKDMEDTEFWKKVHYVASRMINVMQHLESGHLAKVKTEPKPVAPPPPPAPAANDEDTSF